MPLANVKKLSFFGSDHVNTMWEGDDGFFYSLYAGDIDNLVKVGVEINHNEMDLSGLPPESITYKGFCGMMRRTRVRRFRFVGREEKICV